MVTGTASFRVVPGEQVQVTDRPTKVAPLYESKKDYEKQLAANVKKLAGLQERFYAQNTHSLLVVLQAMDTGGKDGLIRHVLSGINPQGCHIHSFGRPSSLELEHDFLWRTSLQLPTRGIIAVFNRSYYEEVLVVKIHPSVLDNQNLPPESRDSPTIWEDRYRSILDHERHLHLNGTRIVKLFLHISKEEQKERLLARIDDPEKNWKFNIGDVDQRAHWDEYMEVYSQCLEKTSTAEAPWYVIPADDKRNARLIASQIIVSTLERIAPDFPEVDESAKADLAKGRAILTAGD